MYRIIENPAFRIFVIIALCLLLFKCVWAEELPDTLLRESTDVGNYPCKYKGNTYQCFLVTHQGKKYVVAVDVNVRQPAYVLKIKGKEVTEVWFHPGLAI